MGETELQILITAVDQASAAFESVGDSMSQLAEDAQSASGAADASISSIGSTMTDLTGTISDQSQAQQDSFNLLNEVLQTDNKAIQDQILATGKTFGDVTAQIEADNQAIEDSNDAASETAGGASGMGAAIIAGGAAIGAGTALLAPFTTAISDAATNSAVLAQLQNELANQINGASGAAAANAPQIATVQAKIQSLEAAVTSASAAMTENTGTSVVVAAAHTKAAAAAATASAELEKQKELLTQLQGPSTLVGQSASALTTQFSNLATGAAAIGISFPESIQALQGFMEQTGNVKETTLAFNDALDLVASGGAANMDAAATTIAGAMGGRASQALKQLVPDITANVGPMQALNDIAAKLGGAPAVAMAHLTTQAAALTSNTQLMGAAFGTPLIGPLTKLVTLLNSIIEKVTTWADEHPKLAASILLVAGALGALLVVGGSLLILLVTIGFISTAFTGAGLAAAGLTAILGILGGVLAVLTSPITLIIVAGVLLGIATVVLANLIYDHWNAIESFFKTIGKAIENWFTAHWQTLLDIATLGATAIPLLIYDHWNAILAFLKDIGGDIESWFTKHWDAMLSTATKGLNAIHNWISNGLSDIQTDWNKVWNDIESFVSGIWNDIENDVKSGVNNVIGLINNLITAIDSINIQIPAIKIPGTNIGSPALDLSFNIPKIPMLAAGGVVYNPVLAMIGEQGPEAVVPLSSLGSVGGAVGGQQINVYIQGGNYLDQNGATMIGNALAKQILQQIRVKNYQP